MNKLIIVLCASLVVFLFNACGLMADYIGDRFTPTDRVDVYYAAKDIKRDYKVIGHISAQSGITDERSKQIIVDKAKSVGADGVIILGIEYTGGKDSSPYNKVEVIQYTE